jgi:hypothetical protein
MCLIINGSVREEMGFRQIQSVDEAKARGLRGLIVFICVTAMITFVSILYDSWEEGAAKAIGFAALFTLIVLALLGVSFGIALPGAKKYIEESWAKKESQNH